MTNKRKNVDELFKMTRRLKVFLLIFLFSSFSAMSVIPQEGGTVAISEKQISLSDLFWKIQKQTKYEFVFNSDDLEEFDNLSIFENGQIEDILDSILEGKNLHYKKRGNVFVITKKTPKPVRQQEKREVKGQVLDEKGNSLPGATVVVQGKMTGAVTDMKGRYTIKVGPKDALTFSFVGYKTQIVLVEGKEKIDVNLVPDAENLQEVSVVAFGSQKKESVVSSITSVKSEALRSSSSDLTSSLAGNVAGVVAWQTGGMPGAMTEEEMNTKFYIRGITSFQSNANIDPLILLDGVEVSKLDLSRIDPDDIESFNVMKDASATAMYGARGANGVIYVKTKKGKSGNVYTTVRYEKIWSMPTREIDVVNPITYMEMYNEALIGRNPGYAPKYTRERIDRTASGEYPEYVYPAVDWYGKLFKDFTVNNHYALNARGGNDKIQYYASLTYNDDEGFLKTDKLNQFDCNIENKRIGFRTNMNIKLNKTADLVINSFSTFDKYRGPFADVRQVYGMAFNSSAVDFAPTYPPDSSHNWPHILFGGTHTSDNPYAQIQQGYQERRRYSTINKVEWIQNLNFLAKGLELRASADMVQTGYFLKGFTTVPALYMMGNYDHDTKEHSLIAINEDDATRTLEAQSQGSNQALTIFSYKAALYHNASWGDHQTSFTGVFTARERMSSMPRDLQESLPERNLGYAARATYGYKSKYFLEASIGINGSERFAKDNKIGYFPAVGVAWLATKEDFLQSTSNWLDYLKIRGSYGQVGNDGIIKNPRFVYLPEVDTTPGVQMGVGRNNPDAYEVKSYANPTVTWERGEQINLGLELKMFKNLVDINADIYQEVRHNIYAERTNLPAHMGLNQNPNDNIGKVRSRGIDISAKIQHAWSSDFWGLLSGTFTYNKAVFKSLEQPSNIPAWQNKIGKEISQTFGYIAEGLFKDQAEIDNAPNQAGDVMPGDIRYRDVDGNGLIDVNDAVPIGKPQTPRIIYGLNGFLHYKSFEFSFAFQGMGDRSFWIDPSKVSPFENNRALLTAFAKDHWTPTNQKNKALWPRLSTANITSHNPQESHNNDIRSTYFMRNGKFIRCKSLELSYYLKKDWLSKYKIKKCKVYARANNPFVISDFDIWDIELGSNGFNYPIQKTFTMGITASF